MLNQKGFSVIQAMVALTIMGTISLGVASQVNHINISIKFIRNKANLEMLAYEFQSLLYSPNRCEKVLKGQGLDVANSVESLGDTASFQNIDIVNNAAVKKLNASSSNNIQIETLSIKVVGNTAAADGTVKAVAKVSGAKLNEKQLVKSNIKDQEFEVVLKVEDNNISTCQSVGAAGAQAGAGDGSTDPAEGDDVGAVVSSMGEDFFVNNTAPTLVDGAPRTSCPPDFFLHGIAENGGFMCKPVRVHLKAGDMADIKFHRGGAATLASAKLGVMASIRTDATLTDVDVGDMADLYTTSVILNSIDAGVMSNVTATGVSDVLIEQINTDTWARVRIKNAAP